MADTHFRTDGGWWRGEKSDKFFVRALKYFRSRNVDAVVHCGDMADRGLVEELQLHADAWHRVFPRNKAPDGHVVEKLFVTGNHDAQGWSKDMDWARFVPNENEWPAKILKMDFARHWERIWGEPYARVWRKTVKGYDFFGMNWIEDAQGEGEAALMRLIDESAPASRPFFFVTHNITHGTFNRRIGKHPGAFGLWGHWHMSAANWNAIVMLNDTTPGVQCPACPAWWRKDGKWMGGGDDGIVPSPIEGKLAGGKWEQGLVVNVYDDMLVIERHEFSEGGSLGPNWVMPFGFCGAHPFSRKELTKKIGRPQFRKGAKLEVAGVGNNIDNAENNFVKGARANPPAQSNRAEAVASDGKEIVSSCCSGCLQSIKISIPLADGNPDSRVYAYEVVVAGDEGTRKLCKAVYAAGCNMGVGHEGNGGVTMLEIAGEELPPGKALDVSVRPVSSLGTKGRAIAKKMELS